MVGNILVTDYNTYLKLKHPNTNRSGQVLMCWWGVGEEHGNVVCSVNPPYLRSRYPLAQQI